MNAEDTVRAYKDLARVERAFRAMKSIDLQIRPVHHWIEPRVRAHVFLCMLGYYVEWHLREVWAERAKVPQAKPVECPRRDRSFHDHDRATAQQERASPVASAETSDAAKRKRGRRRSDDGLPITSFGGLLDHLVTMTQRRRVSSGAECFHRARRQADSTPDRALGLLDTALPRVQ